MRNAKAIKTDAVKTFSPYYIYCLVIAMVYAAVCGMQGGLVSYGFLSLRMTGNQTMMQFLVTISAMIWFFVVIPMEVGVKSFFLNLTRGEAEMQDVISPFKRAYDRAVIILFLRNVKIVLWSLLLIVPGFYKAYEYAMVPYIVAEEPNIGTKEAFRRSKELMNGNRLRLFRLQLSFIGWYILSAIPLFAGFIFLAPYTNTAYALFYEELKKNKK